VKKVLSILLLVASLQTIAFGDDGEKVSMDFVNVDIAIVVKYISELTGKNFIIDDKVSGKVTIISPKMVTKDEAYKVFESILETYGFVAIQSGNITKILPLSEARQKATAVDVGSYPSKNVSDNMITQLIPLKYIPAPDLVNVIRPLIPNTSFVISYNPTNTVILVDLASNRTRIMKIIHQLDVSGHDNSVVVLKLQYASARDMAQKIGRVLKQKGNSVTSQVIADERTNSLVIAGNDFYINRVKRLVFQLDVESPPGREEIKVVYLKNANAEDIAKVLNNISKSLSKLSKDAKAVANKNVLVTPDGATNSLLITASPEEFNTLKGVIDKLDIRRKQVFVEALIFEIRTDAQSKFGVEWRTTSNFNDKGVQGIGGTNFGGINSVAANPFSAGQGLVLGVVDGVINFGGTDYLNIGGLLRALKSEEGVNILSTPNLLTTDNAEARIFVGENIPIIKSSAQTTGATPITNIERKDIGVELKIKPQINESDYVKLDITQKISSISAVQLDKASDIITQKREVTTTVTVKNNQNIIIGGLIRDDTQDSVSKVPLLGDIPILGWLFKSTSTKKIKNNLLIFLTPHIINSDADMDAVTKLKKQEMKKSKETNGKENTTPSPADKKSEKKAEQETSKDRFDIGKEQEEVILFEPVGDVDLAKALK